MFGCCNNNRCRCRCNWCRMGCIPWHCFPCNIGPYILSGTVIGTTGTGVANVTIAFTVNGQAETTTTDANGMYTISVPANASVHIAAEPGLGVRVVPTAYTITNVNGNISGLDFTLITV